MNDATPTAEEELDALLREGRISPEDYDTLQQALAKGNVEEAQQRRVPAQHKLTKKWEGRQLGGVCAGLGDYFGLDAWSLRAVFVLAFLLTGGTAVVVYLVMYFTLPWSERSELSPTTKRRWGGNGAFLISLIALWLLGLFFHLSLVPQLTILSEQMGRPLPVLSQILIRASAVWATPWCLGLQVLILALIYLGFWMAPERASMRRWIPRAVMLGVSLYFLTWLWCLLSYTIPMTSRLAG